MRNLRSVIFGLGCILGGVFLANYFGAEAGAQQQTVTEAQSKRSGLWEAEDCKKISDASGLFLYVSGELLEEADKLKKEGKEAEADESYEGVFFLSELATNYANNFEAYCK